MKQRMLLLAGITLLFSHSALAQEAAPKSEIFGGYSYVRTDGGGNLHGWNGSAGANLNNWFGVFADFSGHYGSSSTDISASVPGLPTFSVRASADTNIHTFLAGPRFS